MGDLLAVRVGVVVWREPDGIFLVSDHEGHPLVSFYAEPGGWWRIVRANGTEVQVWKPDAGPEEITVRALRQRHAVWRSAARKERKDSEMGKHEDKKDKDGQWDKPIPPAEKDDPKGGGKHEKASR